MLAPTTPWRIGALENDTAHRCVVSLERLPRNAEPIARVQVRCGDRRLYGDGPYHSFARWIDDQVVDDRDDDGDPKLRIDFEEGLVEVEAEGGVVRMHF